MASSKTLNDQIWKKIERSSSKEQRELLEWQLQAREPIYKFSDMKVGNHLIKKKSVGGIVLYYHHFLCIGSDNEGRPTIIHYSNTPENAVRQFFNTLGFGSGSAVGQLGIVQEVTLPHKDFIENESGLQEKGAEVERVVWPDELRRYTIEEVIKRARKRKDEKYYQLAKNNCESFVMWCLCDLNISMQSTPLVLSLTEIGGGALRTLYQMWQQIPKVVTECIEKSLGRTAFGNVIAKQGWEGISGLGSIFGVTFTALFEIGIAAYSINEAYKKWNKRTLIRSREKFTKEVIDAIVLALSRSGASIGGMVIGQCILPIPFVGSFIGLLVGTLVGHIFGKGISNSCSSYLASAVDKLTESITAGGETKVD